MDRAKDLNSAAPIQVGAVDMSVKAECANCSIQGDYLETSIDAPSDIEARIARSLARLTANQN